MIRHRSPIIRGASLQSLAGYPFLDRLALIVVEGILNRILKIALNIGIYRSGCVQMLLAEVDIVKWVRLSVTASWFTGGVGGKRSSSK